MDLSRVAAANCSWECSQPAHPRRTFEKPRLGIDALAERLGEETQAVLQGGGASGQTIRNSAVIGAVL